MKKKRLPILLDKKEAEKLLDQPSKKSKIGARNRAILRLIMNTGIRVSEVVNIKTWEIDSTFGDLRITQGKGKKDRDLWIPEGVRGDLIKWEKKRPQSAHYFCTMQGRAIGIHYIQEMTTREAKRAKIEKRIYPHLLRHFFATTHYRENKDLEVLRKILGHTDIRTTAIYIQLAGEDVKASMLNFQYI